MNTSNYAAKNAPVATGLLISCNNLLQQADIRMCSHGLRQLIDDKSCKLIVQTCYQQACCKLFQVQIATSLILADLLQLDEMDKLVATCQQLATSW